MRIASFLLAGCLALAGPVHASSDAKVLTFGIVPQQSASRLAQMWGPLLSALSDRSGYSVQFRTTKDIPTFEACLAAGAFDIAYMNPMHYAVFSQDGGYTAILRQANKRLKGLLVTRVDGARSLDDLDGETLAFPSPGAFGASVLTRAQLAESGVSFEPAYVKSHDSVYRAVAAGLMAGGGASCGRSTRLIPRSARNCRLSTKPKPSRPMRLPFRLRSQKRHAACCRIYCCRSRRRMGIWFKTSA